MSLTPSEEDYPATVRKAAAGPLQDPDDLTATVRKPASTAAPGNAGGTDPAPAAGAPHGRYRLLERLGAGGMGVVWKAWDTELQRAVALKQVRAEEAGDAEARARFLQEARTAARLRHAGIVAVHDVGELDGKPYLTMDYVVGRTFAARLDEFRELKRTGSAGILPGLRSEAAILADVAEAVAHAHGAGIVHRDLKPHNVLLDEEGRAFVTDFGLAKEVGRAEEEPRRGLTVSGQVLGTPAYMSPEQATGSTSGIGPHTDVWALGVMLYEAMTGETPFERHGRPWEVLAAVVGEEPARPRRRNRHLPAELEAIALKAMEKSPSRRYAAAREFAEDLRRWLRGEPVLARRPGTAYRAWRWAWRRRTVTLPATMALLALVFLGAWGWRAQAAEREALRRAASHREAMLERVRAAVLDFQDSVARHEMSSEVQELLARQPLTMLEELIRQDPSYGPAYSWRGEVLRTCGRHAESEADFDRGCALAPEHGVVWCLRGCHRLQQFYQRFGGMSGREFAGRLQMFPQAESAAGTLLRESGLNDLRRMMQAESHDPRMGVDDGRVGIATMHYSLGRFDEALASLAGISRPQARSLRGLAYLGLSRAEEAVREFDALAVEWPRDVHTRRFRARANHLLGSAAVSRGLDPREPYRRAIQDLDRAIGWEPDSALLRHERGLLRSSLALAEQALGLDPRVGLRGALEDFDAAAGPMEVTVALGCNRGNTRIELAVAEAARGGDPQDHFRAALPDFDRACVSGAGVAFACRGRALARKAQWESVHGGDALATCAAAVADLDAALRSPEASWEERASRGAAWVTMGRVEAALGRDSVASLRRAIADLDAALELSPHEPYTLRERCSACLQLGKAEYHCGIDPEASLARCLADADAVLSRCARDPEALYSRAWARVYRAAAQAARGLDPRPEYRTAVACFDDALTTCAVPARFASGRAEARLLWAEAEVRSGGDPRDLLLAAHADGTSALESDPRYGLGYQCRGRASYALGTYELTRGTDSRASFRAAIADFSSAIDLQPRAGDDRSRRGLALLGLADAEEAGGGRLGDLRLRAEADFRASGERGDWHGWWNLARVYLTYHRFPEALAALDEAARCTSPVQRESREAADGIRALLRLAPGAADPPAWAVDLSRGQALVMGDDYFRAREPLERFLLGFDRERAALPEAERARRGADETLRRVRRDVHYIVASCCAIASTGRDGPRAETRAIAPAAAAAEQDAAFRHLDAAIDLGWNNRAWMLRDPDLVPLHTDARWPALLARVPE